MKRFYTEVAVENGALRLDGRPVRTPARAELRLPTAALAEAVAAEWRAQGDRVDPSSMPLTGLANAAIDRIGPDPAPFAAGLARYAESDLLCYRAENPAPLVARQAERWDPLLAAAALRYDVRFTIASGIVHRPQPPATVARFTTEVAALDPFRLAGLSPLVTIGGSLIVALAVLDGTVTVREGWAAVTLDEDWQAEHWGRDELATRANEARREEWDRAAAFLRALA